MAVPARFIRKLSSVVTLTDEEIEALAHLCQGLSPVGRGVELLNEGRPVTRGYIFESGWGCRYRLLHDGRRQILNFVVPGDCIGASAGVHDVAGDTLVTLTPAVVQSFDAAKLLAVSQRHPQLRDVLAWSVRRDYSMLQERIVDIGRRNARERLIHLLLELLERLAVVGLSDGVTLDLPLTQEMLGDALGLSIVHVNRTLRRLNREKLICYTPGQFQVIDAAQLRAISGFDRRYLRQGGFLLRGAEGVGEPPFARAGENGRARVLTYPAGSNGWK